MGTSTMNELAKNMKIAVHEPFAKYLLASEEEHDFHVSLLDCYRLAGHACHSITGAFICTEAAISALYPENKICLRGDLKIEFGSELNERATGPRSNVISYITGSWGDTGFPGLRGAQFSRKNLISYGHQDLQKNEIRFRRLSTNTAVVIAYDASAALTDYNEHLDFPQSWRSEITHVLNNKELAFKATLEIS